jgi:predicted HTH transcriptional regulator
LIADLFRRIEMMEAWGRGMPLILKNAPDVVFREVGNLFIVAFNRPSHARETEAGTVPGPGKKFGEKSSGKKVPKRKFLKESSGKTAGAILELMTENPEITAGQIGRKLGIGDRAVRKQIAKLRDAKLLLRTGGRKLGRWEVLK